MANPRVVNKTATWDCITFGNYYQKNDNKATKDPIKWRVLEVKGNDAFLISDQNLDSRQYNSTEGNSIQRIDVTWETCTLRSWINGYGSGANVDCIDYTKDNFINNAFSQQEQAAIKTTTVITEDNPKYHTKGGNATYDKIYLLSIAEALNPAYGFSASEKMSQSRVSTNTAYPETSFGGSYWWLRSPGETQQHAAYVVDFGYLSSEEQLVSYRNTIRPAIHLDLSQTSLWKYAGTVSAGGVEGAPEIQDSTPTPVSTPKPTIKVSTVKLMGMTKQIAAGKKITLTASVAPANANNKTLTWKSSNHNVATVTDNGVVTFKKKSGGKYVTITATATDGSGKKATYRIKSMKGSVTKLTLSGKKKVNAGASLKLKIKVSASKNANKVMKWESSNSKFATVSSKGVVKAKKAGKGKTVKITVRSTDGSNKSKSIKIKIR